MQAMPCFHCGLPVVQQNPPVLRVLQSQRSFCCSGCKTVCEVIINSGCGDYYKNRTGNSPTFKRTELPQILDKLKLFDHEQIQREFVRTSQNKHYKEAWLILEEIHCAACLWLNEKTLRGIDGVLDVQMDYTGQQVRVRWNPEKLKLSEILCRIAEIGYNAYPFDPSQRESLQAEQKQRSLQRIIFALILGMAVMQTAIGSYFFGDQNSQGNFPLWISISRWANLALTFLILAYPGQLFFRNAWRDLKNRTLGMDVPVVIGLSVAWLGSLFNTVNAQGDVYFESIAMFVLFLLSARYFELDARITATTLLDRCSKIIPQTANLIVAEKVKEVPVFDLKRGDKIRISPGEVVAVDAQMLSAGSRFDESLLTGESAPVMRNRGDVVLAGTINLEQVVELEATASDSESTLSAIHQLTRQSVNYKPYYAELAERIAGKFVAMVLIVAAVTLFYWFAQGNQDSLRNMISVLIVTCPCALAMAAPVALSLSAAGLVRLNVLAVRMSSIEKLAKIDVIVFDKTGTLTSGEPRLTDIELFANTSKDDCLAVVAGMEQGSFHPFAKAIIKAAEEEKIMPSGISVDQIKHYPGQGIQAQLKGQTWRLGNEAFARSANTLEIIPELHDIKRKMDIGREAGTSVLFLSDQSGLQAMFFISDPIRNGTEEFLQELSALGINKTVILSGDHNSSVHAIANKLGIKEAYGELTAKDKLRWIQRYQQEYGLKVMMIGDGINDAPTLAAADISATFSDATDLARNNVDLILLGKGYKKLDEAFRLMKFTRRIILQNLGWAAAYNMLAIPAAAAGLIAPWMAALGMSVSSLIVVLNSLRLKKTFTVDLSTKDRVEYRQKERVRSAF